MLSNLFTQSPDVLLAQKTQKAADRDARAEELERLRAQYDSYTNESKIAGLLPEDVESIKKFLKERIAKIQTSPSMTTDQLLALKENKESFQYETLIAATRSRAKFYNTVNAAYEESQSTLASLKKKGEKAPQGLVDGAPILKNGLDWFKKTKFESKDEYDAKLKSVMNDYKAKSGGVKITESGSIAKAAVAETIKAREDFSISGLISDVAGYVGGYLSLFLIFTGVLLGASLASNLNIYRNWTFRLLYAIYGGLFFFVVIPYTLFYRWLMLGKRPKFYSLIPLVPYHWNNRFVQILLGWMSFRPDEDIYALKEWENVAV